MSAEPAVKTESPYEIIEQGPFFVLVRNRYEGPRVLLPYGQGVKVEWVFKGGRFFINRVFYPRGRFTRSMIGQIAQKLTHCTYCTEGAKIIGDVSYLCTGRAVYKPLEAGGERGEFEMVERFYHDYLGISSISAFEHLVSKSVSTLSNTLINAFISRGWGMLIKGAVGGGILIGNAALRRRTGAVEKVAGALGRPFKIPGDKVVNIGSLTAIDLLSSLVQDIGDWVRDTRSSLSLQEFPVVEDVKRFISRIRARQPELAFTGILNPRLGLRLSPVKLPVATGVKNFLPEMSALSENLKREKPELERAGANIRVRIPSK